MARPSFLKNVETNGANLAAVKELTQQLALIVERIGVTERRVVDLQGLFMPCDPMLTRCEKMLESLRLRRDEVLENLAALSG
jgi:hypothetical protein